MKNVLILCAVLLSSLHVSAQLKSTPVCPPFVADVLNGNVNNVYPKSTVGEVTKAFPCYSNVVEKGTDSICSSVFFNDKGISFYPERNYIEIRDDFKGTLKPALMGTSRGTLFKTLGYPKIKDARWDAFQTEYGTLVLYYNAAGKINKIQFSNRSTETLKLCE
jgi:hypothetical protein